MIKRTPADAAFSNCVRGRAGWRCERCDSYFPKGKTGGLDCSHFYGRGNWSVRFDPDNAFAHCYGCHAYLGSNPSEFAVWALEKRGQGCLDLLLEKKNDLNLGRIFRKTKGKGDIAKHFREQFKIIENDLELGKTELSFEGWY